MRAEYSRAKMPPAPTFDLAFSPPGESAAMHPVPALVDTGSDFTLVPSSYLRRIDAPETRSAFLRGLWSEQQIVTVYLVDLHLGNRVLPDIEVVGIEDESSETEEETEIILGRNVLNRLILLLDGPSGYAEILERRPAR
jgi:hypothetical protein